MSYFTNLGYRDSRGLELTLWKRPSPNRYFGIVGGFRNAERIILLRSPASLGTSQVADKNVKTSLIAGSTNRVVRSGICASSIDYFALLFGLERQADHDVRFSG
jgi:hypothetical protein